MCSVYLIGGMAARYQSTVTEARHLLFKTKKKLHASIRHGRAVSHPISKPSELLKLLREHREAYRPRDAIVVWKRMRNGLRAREPLVPPQWSWRLPLDIEDDVLGRERRVNKVAEWNDRPAVFIFLIRYF